jgi:hypothetical protein
MAAELPLNSVAAGVLERTGIACLPDAAADQKEIQISSDEKRGLDHHQNRIFEMREKIL